MADSDVIKQMTEEQFREFVIQQLAQKRERLDAIELQLRDGATLMAQNTAEVKRLADATAGVVNAFSAAQGAFKVLELLGKIAKPVLVITAAAAALTAWVWYWRSRLPF